MSSEAAKRHVDGVQQAIDLNLGQAPGGVMTLARQATCQRCIDDIVKQATNGCRTDLNRIQQRLVGARADPHRLQAGTIGRIAVGVRIEVRERRLVQCFIVDDVPTTSRIPA